MIQITAEEIDPTCRLICGCGFETGTIPSRSLGEEIKESHECEYKSELTMSGIPGYE